ARTIGDIERSLGDVSTDAADALRALLACRSAGDLAIRAALTAPPGVRRSGAPSPALGRAVTRAAAVARNRALVAQTEAFLPEPFDAMPHYPVWDGNRGFGP